MNKLKSRSLWFNVALFIAGFVLCATGSMRDWVAALMMGASAGIYTASSATKFVTQLKAGVQKI